MSDLPAWVLDLVYRLDRAEEEHPQFFRYVGPPGGRNAYEPVESCYLAPLLEMVPDDVLDGVRLAARWQPTPVEEPAATWVATLAVCEACKEQSS